MGYTHYWERPRILPRRPFAAAAKDCRRLCLALAIPLGDGRGLNQPTFSAAEICFNGRAEGPGGDSSYETFRVERARRPGYPQEQARGDWGLDFCKTNRRPYDLCVQGCLMVLSHHLGTARFRVDSDGTSGDWDEARQACQRVLGYGGEWGEGKLGVVPRAQPAA
jgi:hypothetical protein